MKVTPVIETSRRPEHRIPGELLERQVRVTVVGCGSTGSCIAAGLPYLHQAMLAWGHPHGLRVTLLDGDRITPTNCVRQPFSVSEAGLYKSVVLATRINVFWAWAGAACRNMWMRGGARKRTCSSAAWTPAGLATC